MGSRVLLVAAGVLAVWLFGVGLAGLLYWWMAVAVPGLYPIDKGGIGAGIAIAFGAFAPYLFWLIAVLWTLAVVAAVLRAALAGR